MFKSIPLEIQNQLEPSQYWENIQGEIVTSKEHLDYIQETFGIAVPQVVYTFLESQPYLEKEYVKFYNDAYSVPIVKEISRNKVAVNKPAIRVVVSGDYLSPQNGWSATGGVIVSVLDTSSSEVTLSLNTLTLSDGESFDLMLDDVPMATIVGFISEWVDFRTGGADLGTLELSNISQNEVVRDSEGIFVNVTDRGWSKLLAFPDLGVARTHSEGVQIILKIQESGSLMFGMVADGHGVDNSMYNETHVGFYLSSSASLYGYYAGAQQQLRRGISEYNRLKVVFITTMNPGARYQVYGLRNTDSWDDGILLTDSTIPSGVQDPGDNVYPCLTPNNAVGYRLVAFNNTNSL